MAESIKFGPKWLRNMSVDAGGDSVAIRSQLPEFRYGREEMLSLFDKAKQQLPEVLPRYRKLFIENIQNPLTMTPDTEDEITPLDRLRRGRESYHSTTGSGFQRYSTTEGGRARSSWNGGQTEPSEWSGGAGSTPKKEYITQLENWRKGSHMDEEDIIEERRVSSVTGPSKSSARPQSWRIEHPAVLGDLQSSRTLSHSSSGEDRFFSKGQTDVPKRHGFWDNYDLPEWAMDKSVEGGGSFDRTGAFHGSVTPPSISDNVDDESTKAVASFKDNGSSADNITKIATVAGQSNTVDILPTETVFCKDREAEEQANCLKLFGDNVAHMKSDDINKGSFLMEKIFQQQQHQLEPDRNDSTGLVNTNPPRCDNTMIEPQIADLRNVDLMKEITDSMVDKLFMDDEYSPIMLKKPVNSIGSYNIDHSLPARVSSYAPSNFQQLQHNFMAPLLAEKITATNPNHEWMYRDPEGKMQGPFSATEMAGWYRAGYFDKNLYVRRVSDSRFATLGDLVRLCGNAVPFEVGHFIPPLHQLDMIATVHDIQQPLTMPQHQWQQANPHDQSQYQSPQLSPYQMNMMQKQNLQRNYLILLQKLTSNERQNFLVNQHMSQPPQYNMFYGAGFAGFPLNQTNQQLSMANTAATVAPSIPANSSTETAAIYKQVYEQQSSPYGTLPTAFNASELVQQLKNMYQSGSVPSSSALQFLNSIPKHQLAQIFQQVELDDPIKNMLEQIDRQKGQQMTEPIQYPGSMAITDSQMIFPHQMTEQPRMNMWEIPMPPFKMKTEAQILEEQRSKQLQHDQQQNNIFLEQTTKQNLMQQQQEAQQRQEQHHQRILEKYRQELKEKNNPEPQPMQINAKKWLDVVTSRTQTKESKAKAMVLKKEMLEKERQRQLDEENQRLFVEEKKRLDDIARDRRTKLMEVSQPLYKQKDCSNSINSAKAPVVPWSSLAKSNDVPPDGQLSLAEIQKAERNRRTEQNRVEQLIPGQQHINEAQELKGNALKWILKPHNVKSLVEIQAEESKRQQAHSSEKDHQIAMRAKTSVQERATQLATISKNNVTPTSSSIWNSNTMWSKNDAPEENICGFWEKPTKLVAMSAAAQTAQGKTKTSPNTQQLKQKPTIRATIATTAAKSTKKDNAETEFINWCCESLSAHAAAIDVPTLVGFLKDVDSPFEVKDYVRTYLGDNKECTEFTKNFLERRNKYKSEQRTVNVESDDLCQPARAITPANDLQKAKSSKKEKKKNRMMKLDTRVLGFSVTAAHDRRNIGALDYSDAT